MTTNGKGPAPLQRGTGPSTNLPTGMSDNNSSRPRVVLSPGPHGSWTISVDGRPALRFTDVAAAAAALRDIVAAGAVDAPFLRDVAVGQGAEMIPGW